MFLILPQNGIASGQLRAVIDQLNVVHVEKSNGAFEGYTRKGFATRIRPKLSRKAKRRVIPKPVCFKTGSVKKAALEVLLDTSIMPQTLRGRRVIALPGSFGKAGEAVRYFV